VKYGPFVMNMQDEIRQAVRHFDNISTGWGGAKRDERNGFSVENDQTGICGSYSPLATGSIARFEEFLNV
jgi:hypothetical protein